MKRSITTLFIAFVITFAFSVPTHTSQADPIQPGHIPGIVIKTYPQIAPLPQITAAPMAQMTPVVVATAPAPTPVTAAPVASGSIQDIIIAAANAHGASSAQMLRVAACESGFNLYAHNASGATGLFQFMPATFYGHGGSDLYSASDQANVAASMFAAGQSGQWTCQ